MDQETKNTIISLIDILLRSDTNSNVGSTHSHELFDSLDREKLNDLKDRVLS